MVEMYLNIKELKKFMKSVEAKEETYKSCNLSYEHGFVKVENTLQSDVFLSTDTPSTIDIPPKMGDKHKHSWYEDDLIITLMLGGLGHVVGNYNLTDAEIKRMLKKVFKYLFR